MALKSFALAAGALVLVAGCTSVRIYDPLDGQNYYDGAFEYATPDGTISTVVLGSPVPAPAANLPQIATGHMKGATRGKVVTFEPADWTPPDEKTFRVVAVFNGKPPYTDEDICTSAQTFETEPARVTATLDMAFCQGPHLLSAASGSVDELKSLDDPRFAELVKGVALAMIPRGDLDEISNDGGVFP